MAVIIDDPKTIQISSRKTDFFGALVLQVRIKSHNCPCGKGTVHGWWDGQMHLARYTKDHLPLASSLQTISIWTSSYGFLLSVRFNLQLCDLAEILRLCQELTCKLKEGSISHKPSCLQAWNNEATHCFKHPSQTFAHMQRLLCSPKLFVLPRKSPSLILSRQLPTYHRFDHLPSSPTSTTLLWSYLLHETCSILISSGLANSNTAPQ